MPLSRRDFLKRALAAGPFICMAGCRSGAGSSGGEFDAVVVGAGLSGLVAASTLVSERLHVLVLEARSRLGGRTYTDTTTFGGVPIDLGAQWFHQSGNNALLNYARAHGYTLMPQPDWVLYLETRPSTVDEAAPAMHLFRKIEQQIKAAGEAAAAGGPDPSAAEATADLAAKPWYQLGEAISGPLEVGANFTAFSSRDYYNYRRPPGGDTMIYGGMGAFVASFATGVRIQLSTPVTTVRWAGANDVELDTAAGTVRARTAIITVPFGALAAGNIIFDPTLPPSYRQAVADLPMGSFEKIFLGFSRQVFDVPTNTLIFPLIDQLKVPGVQAALGGGRVALCIVGGGHARELASQGADAMVPYAKDQVAALFGTDVLKYFQNSLATNWLNDPWTLGSYTYAKPGKAPARQLMATPLAQQLFFAGEALSVSYAGNANGAYLSGLAAANQVLSALGRRSAPKAAFESRPDVTT